MVLIDEPDDALCLFKEVHVGTYPAHLRTKAFAFFKSPPLPRYGAAR